MSDIHTHHHTDGHTHPHTHDGMHGHGHNHSHTHDPKEIKKIINRLSKSVGHIEAIKQMLADGRDCSDVLIQLAAVRAEINNAGKVLLKEHMSHCIIDAIEENDTDAVERLNDAIDKFMK